MATKKTESKLTFEQAMARLDEIVRRLEQSDAALEESLALFEEGTALVRFCGGALDEADKRVSLLIKKEGNEPGEVPFSGEENE